jgi:hypothetical protein
MRRLITSVVLVCLGMFALAGCDGSYAVLMMSFDLSSSAYEQALLRFLGAVTR